MNKSKALQLLPQAYALHRNGSLNQAAALYQKILAADPQNADVLRVLGMLYLQQGNWEEGERWTRASLEQNPNQAEAENNRGYALQNLSRHEEALAAYDKAIKLNQAYAAAWYNRGNLLQSMGRYDDAVSSYRQALALRPDHVDTCVNMGNALKSLGRYEDALPCYEKALVLNPRHAIAHNNMGNTLKVLKRHDEALASFNKAISLAPEYADAYFNAALALQDLERFDDAKAAYQKTIAVKPDHAEAHLNLGQTFYELKKFDEALAAYDKAIVLKPAYTEAHLNQGIVYKESRRFDEALAAYGKALTLRPDYIEAYLNRGLVLQDMRRFDEALVAYDKAISLKSEDACASKGSLLIELGRMSEAEAILHESLQRSPDEIAPLLVLLSMKRCQHDDPLLSRLEAHYAQRESLSLEMQLSLCFTMGKAMENIGEYDKAFSAYEQGNRLHYQEHPFDEAVDRRYLESTCNFFTSELFGKCAALAAALPPVHDERTPIFIVGMPRSGTTLIEQVLDSHPALFGAGELDTLGDLAFKIDLPPLDSPDWGDTMRMLRELGQKYLDQVWKLAPEARYITDKMPHNFRWLGLIPLMLPNAKIIHSMRDPMDVCFSCYSLSFKGEHDYSYDLAMLGRHYQRYKKLMEHWHNVLPPGWILDVHYEDNVADLEGQAKRLLEFIGLPWDASCLNFYENKRAVRTASVTQVRKPIYSSSVARWKHFEKHLGPLLEIVGSSA